MCTIFSGSYYDYKQQRIYTYVKLRRLSVGEFTLGYSLVIDYSSRVKYTNAFKKMIIYYYFMSSFDN